MAVPTDVNQRPHFQSHQMPYLDEQSFEKFAPLLSECQEYAEITRFCFRKSDFPEIGGDVLACERPDVNSGSEDVDLIAAKIKALPAIAKFSGLLNPSAPTLEHQELLRELDLASRIVIKESVRNIMISTCKGLVMFPPDVCPEQIESSDCFYEDVTACFPVIAQRLYNEVQVRGDLANEFGLACLRRAQTASFILDFAEEMGLAPEMPESCDNMLKEFQDRVSEWQEKMELTACDEGNRLEASLPRIMQESLDAIPSAWQSAMKNAGMVVSMGQQKLHGAGEKMTTWTNDLANRSRSSEQTLGSEENISMFEYAETLDLPWYDVMYHY